MVGVCHVWLCRLECSKSLLSEVLAVDELVMSHERQLSQLSHLSDNSATLRQTREQLQVSSLICATWRQIREQLQVSSLICATLRQTREQLQVSSVICATLRQTHKQLQVSCLRSVSHLFTSMNELMLWFPGVLLSS